MLVDLPVGECVSAGSLMVWVTLCHDAAITIEPQIHKPSVATIAQHG